MSLFSKSLGDSLCLLSQKRTDMDAKELLRNGGFKNIKENNDNTFDAMYDGKKYCIHVNYNSNNPKDSIVEAEECK